MVNLLLIQEATGITITAEMIVALGAIITALLTFISSKTAERRSAKKDEVQLLRDEVTRLQSRVDELIVDNESWRKKYDILYNYVLDLRKILADYNIGIPVMPNLGVTRSEVKTEERKILKERD